MNKKSHPWLISLSAPSGTGKTTLCKKLLESFRDLILSISATTRQPRGSEQNGVDYFFLSENEFKKKIAMNEFAEWALVHGNYYGTLKSEINAALSNGKSVLFDIDVQGAKNLKRSYPNQCVTVFVSPPSIEALEERLRKRGTDSELSIKQRLENAKDEMAEKDFFDVALINDNLEETFKELKMKLQKNLRLNLR